MALNKNIIVCGDIHGYWRHLNELISKKNPELILQCGDFGWWPKFHETKTINSEEYDFVGHTRFRKSWNQFGIKNPNTIILFAPGNHEDWTDLALREETTKEFEVMPDVHYRPFASLYELPDGRIVMFCGGAFSMDKDMRTPGIDWFHNEIITDREMMRLDEVERVDIVISHTCPVEFAQQMHSRGIVYINENISEHRDSSRQALSYVLQKYNPSLWYFAHFHVPAKGMYNNTKWYAMNMAGVSRPYWWRYLKE